uniref:Uncharacterized protein n=1 Tax=Plectus sambesii TaxID=2011161 RepID=A0A914W6R8_9BILA
MRRSLTVSCAPKHNGRQRSKLAVSAGSNGQFSPEQSHSDGPVHRWFVRLIPPGG